MLSLGREYGNSFYTTVQDINQFKTIYGNQASTLLGLMNTKLFMAVESPEAAEWMSKALFNKEYLESREGRSYGANTIRDGVNISKDKRNERIVTPGEIAGLDELEGYLKFPGNLPVAKVYFTPYDYKEVAPDLEPRDISSSDFDLSKVMPVGKNTTTVKSVKNGSGQNKELKDNSSFAANNSKNNSKENCKSEQKTKRKSRNDKGKSRKKKNTTNKEQEPIEIDNSEAIDEATKDLKTVVGYVASPKAKKNESKQTLVVTVNLAQNSSSNQDGFVTQTTIWHKLIFFDKLADSALKQIKKGCRVEAYGEYRQDVAVNEDTGEENIKHEIIVKKFKILSNAREKKKPKEINLKKVKAYEDSKGLKRGEYVYEIGSHSIGAIER